LDDDAIREFEEAPSVVDIPSNSQFVERLIQTITKIGPRSATAEIRDGLTRATLKNQKRVPRCETKADFHKL